MGKVTKWDDTVTASPASELVHVVGQQLELIFRSFHQIERNNCLCDMYAQQSCSRTCLM